MGLLAGTTTALSFSWERLLDAVVAVVAVVAVAATLTTGSLACQLYRTQSRLSAARSPTD